MGCKAILWAGLVALLATPMLVQADSCPAIQCDCGSLTSERWQALCQAREQNIKAECAEAGGIPQSYCGVHGPKGKPLALSINVVEPPDAAEDAEQVQTLNRQIGTQLWSLRHDLNIIKTRHEEGQFNQAVQVARLLERNVETLFAQQRSALLGAEAFSGGSEHIKLARTYREDSLSFAGDLDTFAQALWQEFEQAGNEQRVRLANKVLSFRLSRLVAQTLEQAAYLSSASKDHSETARIWQRSAGVAERLVDWQMASDNQQEHKEFYREQAAARWHRATYYWLQSNDAERAVASTQSAQEVLLSLPERAMVNAENDPLNMDDGDMSAIRRGDAQ